MSMMFPVQTATWPMWTPEGSPALEMADTTSLPGPYAYPACEGDPPHTIIRLPVQTAVWPVRTPRETVLCHLLREGSYRPPRSLPGVPYSYPPATTMRVPVQTAVCP